MADPVQVAIKQEAATVRQNELLQGIDRRLGLILDKLKIDDPEGDALADHAREMAEAKAKAEAPPPDSADWRARSVDRLEGIPPSLMDTFAEESIATAGDLSDRLDSGEHIPGVGEARAAKLREMLDDLAKPE